jgi:sortase A
LSEKRRKIVRSVGLILIAAALCAIGYSVYNLISTDISTQDSLLEAEQMMNDMAAYTGSPQDTAAPGETAATGTLQPGETAAPGDDTTDGTDGISGNGTDGTDAISGDGSDTDSGDAGSTKEPSSQSGSGDSGKQGGSTKSSIIGILILDSLGGRKVPLLEGTSAKQLSRGAAHHPRSSQPGATGNCVIYGHRNTVFRGFAGLKVGDTIRLEVPGKTYTYCIKKMAVVNPDDKLIFHAYGQAALTLVTCYPFNYIGAAPQRYIVVAMLQ